MRIAALALAALVVSPAIAAPRAFDVREVEVLTSGRFVPDPNGSQTPADCARFSPGAGAVRRWFRRAREVEQLVWLEEGDWTSCRADGVAILRDGRRLRFELDQGGRAQVTLSPTRSVYLLGAELPSAAPGR